jgi:hypothetical protein
MEGRKKRLWLALALVGGAAAGGVFGMRALRRDEPPAAVASRHADAVALRLAEFGEAARARWRAAAARYGGEYPPRKVVLAAFKTERRLDVIDVSAAPRWWRSIPILGASGVLGPKLREGDRQVPEGVYACEFLNPNSRFRVSLRVGYPNADDRARAAREGRAELGGDIMIHGGSASIGCLAIGDPAAEDVFTLAADVGIANVEIVIAPCDLRVRPRPTPPRGAPPWTGERWDEIAARLSTLPAP